MLANLNSVLLIAPRASDQPHLVDGDVCGAGPTGGRRGTRRNRNGPRLQCPAGLKTLHMAPARTLKVKQVCVDLPHCKITPCQLWAVSVSLYACPRPVHVCTRSRITSLCSNALFNKRYELRQDWPPCICVGLMCMCKRSNKHRLHPCGSSLQASVGRVGTYEDEATAARQVPPPGAAMFNAAPHTTTSTTPQVGASAEKRAVTTVGVRFFGDRDEQVQAQPTPACLPCHLLARPHSCEAHAHAKRCRETSCSRMQCVAGQCTCTFMFSAVGVHSSNTRSRRTRRTQAVSTAYESMPRAYGRSSAPPVTATTAEYMYGYQQQQESELRQRSVSHEIGPVV